MLRVQYAPLRVPWRRRVQTLAVALWCSLIPLFLATYLLLLLLSPRMGPWMVAYCVFIILDPSAQQGGRRPLSWVRGWRLWHWMRDYFPMRLVRTARLDPSRNYVFAYHPHGIISLGAFINFGTEATGFSRLFPGLDFRLLTLNGNFWMPFARELLLSLGICAVSRRSCDAILSRGPGSSCMIVVGGAAEALHAFPGTAALVLQRRMGFVKLALRHGAWLVPVFAFGENDLWDQVATPPGSLVHSAQVLFKKYMSFSPPLLHGRGVFTYNFGVLPYRRPVTTVVGKAIEVPRIEEPTTEQVELYHAMYVRALQALFDKYRERYAPHVKGGLVLLD